LRFSSQCQAKAACNLARVEWRLLKYSRTAAAPFAIVTSKPKNISVTVFLGLIWVATVAFGARILLKYERTPGRAGAVSSAWPSASALERSAEKSTLIATARQIERLRAAGARSYLTKPLDIGEFFRVIDETMQERKAALECAAA
jgi:hypothetical protein